MKTFLVRLGMAVLVLLLVAAGNVAAAPTTFYVNVVTGLDGNNGLSPIQGAPGVGPKQTIGNAILAATDGDIISVDYGLGTSYNEAVVANKNLTFLSTNGSPNVLSMTFAPPSGVTFGGPFTLTTGLSLQTGTVSGAGNLTLGNGATIVRDGGSLSGVPTFGASVNVTYVGVGTYVTGPEIPVSATALNNLTLNKSGGVVTLAADMTVNGDLTITAGTLNTSASNYTVTMRGNFFNSGTFTANGSQIVLDAATSTSLTIAGFSTTGGVRFRRPASGVTTFTGNVTAGGDLDVNPSKAFPSGSLSLGTGLIHQFGSVFISLGELDGSSSTLILKGNMSVDVSPLTGTFLPSNSTVIFNGNANAYIQKSGAGFNNLIIDKSSAYVQVDATSSVSGNLTLSTGELRHAAYMTISDGTTITRDGGFMTDAPPFLGSVNVTYVGAGTYVTGPEIPVSTTALNNLTVNKSGGEITLAASMTVNGDMTITAGTLNTSTSNYTVTMRGNFFNSGTFTANGSQIILDAATSTSLTIAGFSTTGGVRFRRPPSGVTTFTGNVTAGGGLTVNTFPSNLCGQLSLGIDLTHQFGSVTISHAQLDGGSSTMILKDNMSVALPPNTGTFLPSNSTVIFNGNANAYISGAGAGFNNLIIDKQSAYVQVDATSSVSGTLTLSAGELRHAAYMTISDGTTIVRDGGFMTEAPPFLGSVNVTYIGGGTYVTGPEIPVSTTALNNLTLNKSGGMITLAANATVNGTLALGTNNITTGSYTLAIASGGSVTRTSGYVIGGLQKHVGATGESVFEVGDNSYYTPVVLNVSTLTSAGDITAKSVAGDHPNIATSGINAGKSVNRYWTLTNSGTNAVYDATFNFNANDIDASATPSNFVVRRYNAGWFSEAVGARNPTSTQITGETGHGDFAIGEPFAFTVTSISDSGVGSLRQAILDANATPGLDNISFNIDGTPPFTIVPNSALPSITESVVIDATTQPGFAGQPIVEIDGSNAGSGANGLYVLGYSSTIRGLVINRFNGYGIVLAGCNNGVIERCRIGTDPGGLLARGNMGGGILLWGTTSSHIGGPSTAARNIICANGSSVITPGIYIYDNANGNHIEGNFIGIGSDGLTALGNNADGVWINDSRDNFVGGDTPLMGNLISANSGDGVHILDETSTGNKVIGNLIGTTFDGSSPRGNGKAGVRLNDAPNNVVGGSTASQRNIISGNASGVVIQGPAGASHATGNLVVGNYIGTNQSGNGALPNTQHGILMGECSSNTIGDATAADRNIISGNGGFGILLTDNAHNNKVLGNYIGTNYTGSAAIPNFIGVHVLRAKDNLIGGHSNGEGNLISGNSSDGILIYGEVPSGATDPVYATGNVLEGNYIGTDASGTQPLANQANGVRIDAYSQNNVVGGLFPGSRNVISGNAHWGIVLAQSTSGYTTIVGNHVGTNLYGPIGPGNGEGGITVKDGASDNTIGGTTAEARNLISSNAHYGVLIESAGSGNKVQGNDIGWNGAGSDPRYAGISIYQGNGTLIGGSTAAAGNIIHQNNGDGVAVSAGSGVAILSNEIYGNLGLGIDLGAPQSPTDNVTLNDPLDADAGPNNLQNYPVIRSALPGSTTIEASLSSSANTTFTIQFFLNAGENSTGFGEGEALLGTITVLTGSDGSASFSFASPATLQAGRFLTATATDPANNTSEFSQAYLVSTARTVSPAVGYASEEYAAGLPRLGGIALDIDGKPIIAAPNTGQIYRVSSRGNAELLAYGFNGPVGVAVDNNRILYVLNAETPNFWQGTLHKVDLKTAASPIRSTDFTTVLTTDVPRHVQVGPDGWIYLCLGTDSTLARIAKADVSLPSPPLQNVCTFPTGWGQTPEGFVVSDGGNILVTFPDLGEVRQVDGGTGQATVALQNAGAPAGIDIGIDGKSYIATADNLLSSKPNSQTFSSFFSGLSGGRLNDVVIDADGDLFVSDAASGRIFRIIAPREQKLAGNSLTYVISQDGDPLVSDGSDVTAIRNGFKHWQDVSTSILTFVDSGLTPQKIAVAGDGVNLVTFQDNEFPFPPFVLAVTAKTMQIGAAGDIASITDADIMFNPSYSNSTQYSFGTDTKSGLYDIESIVTHESGHTIGLVHSGIPSATMFFVLQPGSGARTLTHDDEAWVSYLYPEPSYNTSYGAVAGRVEDGYHQGSGIAGALILATSTTTTDSVHAYTDRDGSYFVPGLAPDSYKIYLHALDGDVFGYPLTADYVSAYLQMLTKVTDFPPEFYNSTGESGDPTTDIPSAFTPVPVTGGAVTSNINVITNQDMTPPTVVSVFPSPGTTTADITTEILVTFSEPISKATVTGSTFSLKAQSGAAVQGSVLYLNNYTVLLFTPSTPLAFNTAYNIQVLPGITDLKGNSLATAFNSTFVTIPPDTVRPAVEQIVPPSNADSVFITTPITMVFSESVLPATVQSGFNLSGPLGHVAGTFTFEQGTKVVTFKPSASLAEGTTYTVTAAGITDLAGNAIAGTFTSSFTTVPVAAPQIVHYGPYDGEQGVTTKTPVLIDFSEPIDTTTVTLSSFQLLGPLGQVNGSFEFLLNDSRLVFRPSADLEFSTTYHINITTAVLDVSSPAQHLDLTHFGPLPKTFTTATKPMAPEIFDTYPAAAIVGAGISVNGQGFDPNVQGNIVEFGGIKAVVTTASLSSLTMTVPQGVTPGPVNITVTVGGTKSQPFPFTVIDANKDPTNEVVSTVSTSKGTRSGDITPDAAYAYVTNSVSNTVSVIDLKNYTIVGTPIPVGSTPMKIAINPAGTYAYVTNYNSNTVSVIDIRTASSNYNKVVATIPVGINPIGVVVTPDGTRVYVAELTSKSISIIDANENSGAFNNVVATVNTSSGNRNAGVNPDGTLAFFTGTAGLTILDISPPSAAYNHVVSTVNPSTGTRDVGITPDGTLAVVTTMDGYIWIIDVNPKGPSFGNVVAKVPTSSGSRDVGISPDGTLVYVTDSDNNTVNVYQFSYTIGPSTPDYNPVVSITVTLKPVDTIPVGKNPEGIFFSPKADILAVANSGSDNVSIIKTRGQQVDFVLLATNSIELDSLASVRSGNIVVNDNGPGIELVPGYELSVGPKSSVPSGYTLRANRIQVMKGATVASWVQYNQLNNNGTITGQLITPLQLPVYATLPAFTTGPVGTTDVTVQKGVTRLLEAKSYRDIYVKQGGKLILKGGIYNVRNVSLEASAYLYFQALCEVRIQGGFITNNKSYVGPATTLPPGSNVGASSIIFYVAGINGKSGKLDERPSAVDIGPNNTILANIYASNGLIRFGPNAQATGSFIGRDVLLGESGRVTFDSYFLITGHSLPKLEPDAIVEEELPEQFDLTQNYPNPFNPSTTIRFDLPKSVTTGVHVTLDVYDMLGRHVAQIVNGDMVPGRYTALWDGTNMSGRKVATGAYLFRITAGDFVKTKKMILLK